MLLPTEIYGLIVDSTEDNAILSQVACVSKDLQIEAERILYRDGIFTIKSSQTPSDPSIMVLHSIPQIGQREPKKGACRPTHSSSYLR